jgi:hypothetical protein
LAVSTTVTSPAARADPARARGLRRSRVLAPLPEVEPTPMPAPVEVLQLLALLTRVRGDRVAAGELSPKRLHDVRAFKCCFAELGYLRRLAAAGRHGGTVVTSVRQLVTGLAAMHPEWDMTGDGFDARDRHHQAVRRRLRDLEAMGLLRWQIGLDLDGEERRTEIELRDPATVSVQELQAAAVVLARWQARYGPALNTGSKTGIRNAARHGRPLSASERQRRGCAHTRRAAARRRVSGNQANSAPPSGASASLQNNTPVIPQPQSETSACQRTGVTRAHESDEPKARAALERAANDQRAGLESGVPEGEGGEGSPNGVVGVTAAAGGEAWDEQALLDRVAARQAQRSPLIAAIARHTQAPALEVAGWTLQRGWPQSRLREAWVVVRWGATVAADSGPTAAGPLSDELYVKLRRAVARYERNAAARPDGYPTGGLCALLHIGVLAGTGELPDAPRLLGYAIGRLDQLSKRMRARATADSVARHEAAAARAQRRHASTEAVAERLRFRTAKWPAWILLPGQTDPTFTAHGRLLLNEQLAAAGRVPAPSCDAYRLTIRDAYLLAGHPLPVELDGRQLMALRDQRQIDRAARPQRPSIEELELRELAHRTGEPISRLRHTSPTWRQNWLQHQRVQDAARAREETAALRAQLAGLHDPAGNPDQ